MAAAAATYESIKQQIAQRKLAPVYLLHGEEGYFLDQLVKDFEQIIPEADREFNQYILYAPEMQPGVVMDICGRYPMMAERQLVILKEAQAVRADLINKLSKYVMAPSPATVFVIVFRGEAAKGKDLIAAAKAKGVIFESKKVREWQLPQYISNYIKSKGLTAQQKAQEMLADFIGSDLSRLYNEIDKLAEILGPRAEITPEAVERNIGISKEFNNFELIDALAVRNAAKAMRIVDYFASNPKSNPLVATTGNLFNFFSDMLVAYYTPDKSEKNLQDVLKYKTAFQARKIQQGMRYYNPYQVIDIISAIRRFDAQSKGNGSRQDPYLLLRDLVFRILSTPGIIEV